MTGIARLTAVTLLVGVAACEDAVQQQMPVSPKPAGSGEIKADSLPAPADPLLAKGKTVWAGTCQPCHGTGLGGAPRITDRGAWEPRIAQGVDVLVAHAVNGFNGKKGEMPARGGNDKLSDNDITAAVRFMVSLSN